jgi:hypothetical protein
LRFGQHVGDANRGAAEGLKNARERGRVTVKQARERQQAFALNVRAAKSRNISGHALAELVVEDAEAGVYDRLGIDLPCRADARREISLVREA